MSDQVFGIAQAVISIIQVDNHFGQHTATLTPHEISTTIMWATINQMLQIFGSLLVRLSCCLLVLRMPPVGHTKQLHARAIYLLMVFYVLISTSSFFLLCFRCTPIQGLWDSSTHARCIPTQTWDLIWKVDGSMLPAPYNLPRILLTMNSFRNCYEFLDRQSSVHLLAQPSDSSKRQVGSPNDRFPGLWVSSVIYWMVNPNRPEILADEFLALLAPLFAECTVD